jgi:phosphoglycolate phosphatase-like HAD superfamily hydrolase
VTDQWYAEALESAAIFDIDGVLADASGVLEELKAGRHEPGWEMDWDAYNARQAEFPVHEGWRELCNATWQEHWVVLLTNRPESEREVTLEWLNDNKFCYDELRMRDGAHYNQAKRDHLDEMVELGYQFKVAVDDDPMHQEMYESYGIPFVYVHSGYYEDGRLKAQDDDAVSGLREVRVPRSDDYQDANSYALELARVAAIAGGFPFINKERHNCVVVPTFVAVAGQHPQKFYYEGDVVPVRFQVVSVG